MVFLPDQPADMFKHAFSDWEYRRDVAPGNRHDVGLSTAAAQPSTGTAQASTSSTSSVDRACIITSDFISGDGYRIQYKKGMQGHFLGESTTPKGMRMAKIFIQGITEHGPDQGQANKWVPVDRIEIGPHWRPNLKDWAIDLSPFKASVRWDPTKDKLSDDKVAKTINNLLQAFMDTPADFMGESFFRLVKNVGLGGMSSVILRGIKDAGIYEVLLQDNFTCKDILDAATCHINNSSGSGSRGIYVRFHKSAPDVKNWSPNTTYAYVGQTTVDFATRFQRHRGAKTKYGDLTLASTSLHSCALCILAEDTEIAMYYVAEQVFVCLLGTYRASVLRLDFDPTRTTQEMMFSLISANYCHRISSGVFQSTGWSPAVPRPGFGITAGTNFRSPLEELGFKAEKVLFIRTDYLLKDHDLHKPVPVAEFRRVSPVKAKWSKIGAKQLGHTVNLYTLKGNKGDSKPKTSIVHFGVHRPLEKATTSDFPPEGADVHLIFEIRLDGQVINNSWARLPEVAIFRNSDQASSFAVRYEWEHPKDSGKWRHGYIQHGKAKLYSMRDEKIPGSLSRLGKAIRTVQWLLRGSETHMTWMPTLMSPMRFLKVKYDFMTQSITFSMENTDAKIVPMIRNSPDNISQQMTASGLGGTLDQYQGNSARTRCDLCTVLPDNGTRPNCKVKGSICEVCRLFGLPHCSFTPNMSSLTHKKRLGGQISTDMKATDLMVKVALACKNLVDVDYRTHSQDSVPLDGDDGDELESEDESPEMEEDDGCEEEDSGSEEEDDV